MKVGDLVRNHRHPNDPHGPLGLVVEVGWDKVGVRWTDNSAEKRGPNGLSPSLFGQPGVLYWVGDIAYSPIDWIYRAPPVEVSNESR